MLDIDENGDFADVDFTAQDLADALNNVEATDGDVSAGDIAGALADSDTDFSGADLANLLADSNLDLGSGDVTTDELIEALQGTPIGDALDIEDGGFSDVDFTPDDLLGVVNEVEPGDGGDVDLPVDGTTFTITDLGFLGENVFEAVPTEDGGIEYSDVLMTPMGDIDLTWLVGLFDQEGTGADGLGDGLGDTVDPDSLLGGTDAADVAPDDVADVDPAEAADFSGLLADGAL